MKKEYEEILADTVWSLRPLPRKYKHDREAIILYRVLDAKLI